MKTTALVALTTLAATSAFAQDFSLAYRGGGSRAGGPAYILNRGGEICAGALPSRRSTAEVPLAYRGGGSRAGGPAYLLNPGTKPF